MEAQALMSGINALPAAGQKVQFDAGTGTKSPSASLEPSFWPENMASLPVRSAQDPTKGP